MSRYSKTHYEDVAGILNEYDGSYHTVIKNIAQGFADLFAADNPLICAYCGDDGGTTSICTRPNEGHSFHGFDREQFLTACGLATEQREPVVDGRTITDLGEDPACGHSPHEPVVGCCE